MQKKYFISTSGNLSKLRNLEIKENLGEKKICYTELLDRIIQLLKINQSDSNINEKIIISPPKIKKDLKGRYLSKGIENILRKYIREYVLCKTCKSAKTDLQKDSFSKLLFIYCFRCFASRSVNGISKAYFAKMKRKK